MRRFGEVGLRIARSHVGGVVAGLVSSWAPGVIPGVLHIDSELVVLRHPAPTERVHLLVLSRQRLADAHDLRAPAKRYWDALSAWFLAHSVPLGVCAAVTNVGSRQDVRLLHVHLIDRRPSWIENPNAPLASTDRLANAIQEAAGRADLHGQHVSGGSYAFAIPSDGVLWSVWAQATEATA